MLRTPRILPSARHLAGGCLLALAACGDKDVDSGERSTPENFSDCRTADADDFDYGEPSIDGDTLTVPVSYSGGCEDHDFIVCWPDQAFAESDPVQVALELWHDAHRDTCEAYVSEAQIFDLNPLKEAYKSGYQIDEGTILVTIGSTQIEYTF